MNGLSHVEIYVSDLASSVEFWGWLLPKLGFTPFQQWESGRSWRLESTYLVLVQAEPSYKDQSLHRKRPGLNHLAFWAQSTDQIESITIELRQKGIPILYEDRNPEEIGAPSQYAVYFEDPDRLKVELVLSDDE